MQTKQPEVDSETALSAKSQPFFLKKMEDAMRKSSNDDFNQSIPSNDEFKLAVLTDESQNSREGGLSLQG